MLRVVREPLLKHRSDWFECLPRWPPSLVHSIRRIVTLFFSVNRISLRQRSPSSSIWTALLTSSIWTRRRFVNDCKYWTILGEPRFIAVIWSPCWIDWNRCSTFEHWNMRIRKTNYTSSYSRLDFSPSKSIKRTWNSNSVVKNAPTCSNSTTSDNCSFKWKNYLNDNRISVNYWNTRMNYHSSIRNSFSALRWHWSTMKKVKTKNSIITLIDFVLRGRRWRRNLVVVHHGTSLEIGICPSRRSTISRCLLAEESLHENLRRHGRRRTEQRNHHVAARNTRRSNCCWSGRSEWRRAWSSSETYQTFCESRVGCSEAETSPMWCRCADALCLIRVLWCEF